MEQQLLEAEMGNPFSVTEQEELVQKLKYEYDTARASVAPLHKKIDSWHKIYEAARQETKNFPWANASNFTVPLILSVLESVHARIMKAVFDVDPIWLARARTPEAVPTAKKAEWYIDYWADEMNIASSLDMLVQNMLIEGTGVIRIDWASIKREIPQPRGEFGQPMLDQTGQPAREFVTEYEGPEAKVISLKDFVLIPADAPTMEEAVYVGHRVFLSHGQLVDRRDNDIYFNVDELLSKSQGDPRKDRKTGASNLISAPDNHGKYEETQQYEVVEIYGPYDFGDGPVPALMTFSPVHSILLRLEPFPYEYGRSPYVDFNVYPRPNSFFGRSQVDILESAQEEMTALHNMRSDAIVRRIAPPLLVRRGAVWDPEEQPWAPGQTIEVSDMTEIQELMLQDVPGSLFAHGQEIMAFVERVTGMSDYTMGRSPTQNRTATEVNRVTSEGLARMDILISRFQRGMGKVAWMLWWLLYQYRPYIDLFHAENQNMAITKQDMRPGINGLMPFEFIPQGQLSDASKEARRQQLMFLLNTASPSLTQFYPDGIQKLLKEIFESFDVKNVAEMLGPDWNLIQQQMQQAFQQGMEQGAAQAQEQAKNETQ